MLLPKTKVGLVHQVGMTAQTFFPTRRELTGVKV